MVIAGKLFPHSAERGGHPLFYRGGLRRVTQPPHDVLAKFRYGPMDPLPWTPMDPWTRLLPPWAARTHFNLRESRNGSRDCVEDFAICRIGQSRVGPGKFRRRAKIFEDFRKFREIAVVMEEYLRVQSSALGLFLFLGAHSTGGDTEFR